MRKIATIIFPVVGVLSLLTGMKLCMAFGVQPDSVTSKIEEIIANEEANTSPSNEQYTDKSKEYLEEYRLSVEKRCAKRDIISRQYPNFKYSNSEENYKDWEEVLSRIYAQYRSMANKEDLADFIEEEKDWDSKTFNESKLKSDSYTNINDRKYYYYTYYADEIAVRCAYLIRNKLT